MSAAALFSGHSSNPFEVGSSDRQNNAYRGRLADAQRKVETTDNASSDDPLNSFNAPEIKTYQSHLTTLFPDTTMTASRSTGRHQEWHEQGLVDLDEGMDSDEEVDAEVVEVDEEMEEDDFGDEVEEVREGDELEDDEEDAQGETDEEMTIHLKPQEEQEEIAEEIADLETAVPRLSRDYKLIDRLGTGTFSSVYKAIDQHYHDKWDNSVWHGVHPPDSSAYYQTAPRPTDTKVFVAIKRIYVTSGPERIRNEITIMEDCRGCRHVSQLITAFRHHDQIVAIMPFHRNADFRVSAIYTRCVCE